MNEKLPTPKRIVRDALGQELQVGDYVFFYSEIYEVLAMGKPSQLRGQGQVKIMLYLASKTTRPKVKYSKDMMKIDINVMTAWRLTLETT